MAEQEPGSADLLVIFGITGDLARVETFPALYRLERRALLDCPVIGVAREEWSDNDVRCRLTEALEDSDENLDPAILARLADRMHYVGGDITGAQVYRRLAEAVGDATTPMHYLAVPASLFSTVVAGLGEAGLIRAGRVVVEKPFGHDLASARELAAELHEFVPEPQLFRIDHLQGGLGVSDLLALRFKNTLLEPVWHRHYVEQVEITAAEEIGIANRGYSYDALGALRDVVVNHLLQVLSFAAMELPAAGDPDSVKNAAAGLLHAVNAADPARYVRGQFDGYQKVDGVAPDSDTETFAALRLDIDNPRWSGVPFYLRAGKCLPTTRTELRLVFRNPPRLGIDLPVYADEPGQLVVKVFPVTGLRMTLPGWRGAQNTGAPMVLDADSTGIAGEIVEPYESLLHAAMMGHRARFARQDGVEEQWRIVAPLLHAPPPVQPYQPGSWGPAAAGQLTNWHGTWGD
jgi:glucose-6-phosphate 1-dehydrogenase